jgi:hypothetical protein
MFVTSKCTSKPSRNQKTETEKPWIHAAVITEKTTEQFLNQKKNTPRNRYRSTKTPLTIHWAEEETTYSKIPNSEKKKRQIENHIQRIIITISSNRHPPGANDEEEDEEWSNRREGLVKSSTSEYIRSTYLIIYTKYVSANMYVIIHTYIHIVPTYIWLCTKVGRVLEIALNTRQVSDPCVK